MDIKELRKLSGMTQKVFAEYFGIPKRTIENWEGNVNKCPEYLIELIKYKLKQEKIIQTEIASSEIDRVRNSGTSQKRHNVILSSDDEIEKL